MRRNIATSLGTATVLISLAACSSSSKVSSSDTTESTEASTTTSTSAAPTTTTAVVSAAGLAVVACDTEPIRMGGSAETYTAESWKCSRNGEEIRIDLYNSADQQQKADQVVLSFYAQSGDTRTLADLPLVCGDKWAIGADFNTTRDALIASLTAAGYAATTC